MVGNSSSSITINIKPNIEEATFRYLSYSVIAVTEDNYHVEMVSLTAHVWSKSHYSTSSYYGSYYYSYFYISTYKFGLSDYPFVRSLIQWVTSYNPSGNYQISGIRFYSAYFANEFQLKFYTYMYGPYTNDFRINVLLVNSSDNQYQYS